MIYGSVCSGIEAASVAWHPLGWKAAWLSEIEKFPNALLAHHYPDVPNLGDMTKLYENEIFQESRIDLLVGGTPCQSFSVAGLRQGLADPRGNLCLEFLRLVDIKRPRWFVWENVPGVLSSSKGRDFGSFLGAIQQLGYGWAYRILDAQYFGIPQRRRRVFVVGYLGDWRPAVAVLFEPQSLCGNIKKGRKKGQDIAATVSGSPPSQRNGGSYPTEGHLITKTVDFRNMKFGEDEKSGTIQSKKTGGYSLNYTTGVFTSSGETAHCTSVEAMGRIDYESETMVVQAFHENQRAEVTLSNTAGSLKVGGGKLGQGYPAICFQSKQSSTSKAPSYDEKAPALDTAKAGGTAVCITGQKTHALKADGFDGSEDGTGRGQPIVAFSAEDYGADCGDKAPTLRAGGHTKSHANAGVMPAVCIPILEAGARTGKSTDDIRAGMGVAENGDPMFTLQSGKQHAVGIKSCVRRLTPRECERLQGFPDDYTLLPTNGKKVADGPRYKALGNSMAVPVMRWIGKRIQRVENILNGIEND